MSDYQTGADKSGPGALGYSEERMGSRQDLDDSDSQLIVQEN